MVMIDNIEKMSFQYSIFGLKRFSNWRYDWRIVGTKQQASKLPVCQHLSTDYVYQYYHGYSSLKTALTRKYCIEMTFFQFQFNNLRFL
jgi:hypothetical protein